LWFRKSRRQEAEGKRQKAESSKQFEFELVSMCPNVTIVVQKKQKAEGKRQKAEGRRQFDLN